MKKGPSPYTLGVDTAFPVLRDLGSQESESIHRTLLSFNPGYRLKEIIKRHRKSATTRMVNDRLGLAVADPIDMIQSRARSMVSTRCTR